MFLARVTGHVVATQKDKTLNGQKLFVVEPLNVKFDEQNKPSSLGNTGRAIVALDSVGCGEGQLVLVVQGSRDPFGIPPEAPNRNVVLIPGTHSLRSSSAVQAVVSEWLSSLSIV